MKDGYHIYNNKKEFLKNIWKYNSKFLICTITSEAKLSYIQIKDGKYDGWCYQHDHCKRCTYSCPFSLRYPISENVFYHDREEKLKRILKND